MAITEIPKQGLDAVQNGRNYLDQLANKYVVKPKDAIGIGGFIFDYEGETEVTLQADITDHYAENNQFINDNYQIKPAKLTLRGYVGELVQKKASGILGALAAIQNRLTVVPAYLGKYTPQALAKVQAALTKATATVNKIDLALSKVKNIVGFFSKSSPAPTKQQEAYQFLESLMLSRQIFLVQTPYRFFDNMAIETLRFVQDETTRSWSDIAITLKQMRFVEVQTVTSNSASFGGRAAQQRQTLAEKGNTKGSDVPVSTAYNLVAGGT